MENIFFVIRPRRIFVISVFSTTRAAPKQMGGGNNGSTSYTKIDRRKKMKNMESSKTWKLVQD